MDKRRSIVIREDKDEDDSEEKEEVRSRQMRKDIRHLTCNRERGLRMEYKSSRIGYLLSGGRIRSVGMRQGITESEFSYMSDVREWFAQQFRESLVSEDMSRSSYL